MNRAAAWRSPLGPVGLPRVLLLVLLALGVAGMHTLGHGEGGHHEPVQRSPGTYAAPVGSLTGHPETVVAGPLFAAGPGAPTPGGGLELDVFGICLAVLGALCLALWVALTRVDSSRDGYLARMRWATRRLGRAPPIASLGLRVVAVSVLRM